MANASTQEALNIQNIRNDVVILRNGHMRGVLHVSSMNFALKSSDEQEAVIMEFQNFLNSLDFPVQILVNSRFMNIDDYIADLRERVATQQSQLLKMQTQEYTKFIQSFVREANIISTDFYVVVPFSVVEVEAQKGGVTERFKSLIGKQTQVHNVTEEKFQYYKSQLMQRVDFVAAGLQRMGLSVEFLTTEQLITLYWSFYNPGDLRRRGALKPLM